MHHGIRWRLAATVLTTFLLTAVPGSALAASPGPGRTPAPTVAHDGWTVPAAAAAPVPASEPRLVGAGRMDRPAGEDVRFAFDAHGFATLARGTFRVSHYDGGRGGWFAGRIDCLIVAGPVAVATGVVTDSTFPEFVGVRKGFTVYDHGRHDRVGYSWALDETGTESVPLCLSGAPYESVASGDFRVTEWFPPTPAG
ncbi:hypothetical protein ABZS44_25470 [Micromonospora sediminicola]|uniref:hypothetical protein n=1 Tax=Micromonospora sediminicola TaxID=946078 RepID=UPI0033B564F1